MVNDLIGAGVLLSYYLVVCIFVPTLLKYWLKVPLEWTRKTQHVAYSLSIFLLLKLFSSWFVAILAASLLILLAYPALLWIEKTAFYKKYMVDRSARGGELRRQLLYVQACFAILILIFWGMLGEKWHYLIAVSVMAWGFGDAAAALVGKAYGKRRFFNRYIEGAKTLEGTTAMIVFAGMALFLTLLLYAGLPWLTSLLTAAIVAPVLGVVELFSRRGADTLTVPLSAASLLLPLLHLFSLAGL
jgi:phytol kinase